MLTEKQILAIPVDKPELLFTNNLDESKKQYRKLVMDWHPDRKPGVNVDVIAHINELMRVAELKIADGSWGSAGVLEIEVSTGSTYKIRYRAAHELECGKLYVGDELATFVLDATVGDLADIANKQIAGFTFPDKKLKEAMVPFLPVIKFFGKLKASDDRVLIVHKGRQELLLRDVLTHFKTIDVKHVAWIVSRMFNVACYLQIVGVTHNDFSPDTILIDPADHKIRLIGGWWYTAKNGERLKALSSRTLSNAPPATLVTKTANHRIDAEMIKATGRELLGDITGVSLLMNKSLPKPMINWLMSAGSGDLIRDFEEWQNVLKASFGARRFIELKLTASDIY